MLSERDRGRVRKHLYAALAILKKEEDWATFGMDACAVYEALKMIETDEAQAERTGREYILAAYGVETVSMQKGLDMRAALRWSLAFNHAPSAALHCWLLQEALTWNGAISHETEWTLDRMKTEFRGKTGRLVKALHEDVRAARLARHVDPLEAKAARGEHPATDGHDDYWKDRQAILEYAKTGKAPKADPRPLLAKVHKALVMQKTVV
ncbi:MAG: hypothetical protein M5U26_29170 [Planctomycetota bacterium]|nr:hypothetical protein [Planctomycetota bacterium]